jgi:SARP family transcriptional regulator, regulator of embCAB operon
VVRIYLCGRVAIEMPGGVIEDRAFPGRQGRLAFVYLASRRARPVARQDLAEALWGDTLPEAWDTALNTIASRLRALLRPLAAGPNSVVTSQFGHFQLEMPSDTWVDIEASRLAIDDAEGAWRRGEASCAWGAANVAVATARRPFLPEEHAPWIELERQRLLSTLFRGLCCLSDVALRNQEHPLAQEFASEAIALSPLNETAYRRLMQAHVLAGNRGEALRVYARCREVLADELGTDPAPETHDLYLKILQRGVLT